MRVESTFTLSSGTTIPPFSLPDAYGKIHHSHELMGEQGLLVVFACNHCPYVIHLAEQLGAWAKAAAQRGVNAVAIVSNDLSAYPQDGPEYMPLFAEKYGWDFPYLIDADQKVAQSYAAACTPDFFLADCEGKLYYAGQFDETRPRGDAPAHGADLQAALDDLLQGKPPQSQALPASGCNIKWLPGKEPVWFPR